MDELTKDWTCFSFQNKTRQNGALQHTEAAVHGAVFNRQVFVVETSATCKLDVLKLNPNLDLF